MALPTSAFCAPPLPPPPPSSPPPLSLVVQKLSESDLEKTDEELEPEKQEQWLELTTLKLPLARA